MEIIQDLLFFGRKDGQAFEHISDANMGRGQIVIKKSGADESGSMHECWVPAMAMVVLGMHKLIANPPEFHPGHVTSRDYAVLLDGYVKSMMNFRERFDGSHEPYEFGIKHLELSSLYCLLDHIRLPVSVLEGKAEITDFSVYFKNPLDIWGGTFSIRMSGDVSMFFKAIAKATALHPDVRELAVI